MKLSRFLFVCVALCTLSNHGFAAVSIAVNNDDINKTKILFAGFEDSANPQLKVAGSAIYNRIKRNLATTGIFESIKENELNQSSFLGINISQSNPQNRLTVDVMPKFDLYQNSDINAILVAQLGFDESGILRIKLRMWDVLDQRQMFGKVYTASSDKYRKLSNVISDEIFKAVTGESAGHFNSQIVYTSESGGVTNRTRKIRLIDFDGENNFSLTNGTDLVLTPAFSHEKKDVFFIRYVRSQPQIFDLDLQNMRSSRIGNFNGISFAPNPHPRDPDLLLISATIDGNTDIFEMRISTNSAKRLTKNPAIDTTANYSPNGQRIAFSSDRQDGQQIYVMDNDGGSVKRISFGGGSYSKPVWSPDGNLIAFTKQQNGNFQIGIMSPDGRNEKILTSGYMVEGAKWSPNGRYLVYSKKSSYTGRGSIPRLKTIDIVTGFEYEVPTPENEGATDPDWK